ncbi:MAG: NBR1-Ig-like domain-containing protein [Anaerolineae bacterium]|nr:NBR1-Ig-like domain-containing protein [Anaerolineae bacterium]
MNSIKKLSLLLILLAAACSGAESEGTPTATPDLDATAAAMAQTHVPATLTQIALEEKPTNTPTEGASATPSVSATFVVTAAPTGFQSSGECLGALLASETIPDNTQVLPGQTFEKTWWLTNNGDCAWSEEYSFVFNRGTSMGAAESYPFPGYVAPGQSIPFTLNLTAPTTPGTYTSFWELSDPDGNIFGVGLNGGQPFWVQIVVPGPTSTPKLRLLGPQSWGSIRSDGHVSPDVISGDNGANLGFEAFITFSFGNLPPDARILNLVLDIDQSHRIVGEPFQDLGCLSVYADNWPGIPLWTFCSENDLSGGAYRTGGADAIAALEDALALGEVRLTFIFELSTNDDNARDQLIINEAILRIDWVPGEE